MFCNQCGKQISDNSKFCYLCGAPVEQISQNQTANQPQPQSQIQVQPQQQIYYNPNNNYPNGYYQQTQNNNYTQPDAPYSQPVYNYNQTNNYNSYPYVNNTADSGYVYNQAQNTAKYDDYTYNESKVDSYYNNSNSKDESKTINVKNYRQNVLPLFSSPLFIIFAVFASFSLIINIWETLSQTVDAFTYALLAPICYNIEIGWSLVTYLTIISDTVFLTALILLIIFSAIRSTSLSEIALSIISIWAYVNMGAYILAFFVSLFSMNTFFEYDTNILLAIALYIILPFGAIVFKRIGKICSELKDGLYFNQMNTKIGVYIQISLSVMITFMISTIPYDFTVIFSVIQYLLLIIFLFILKAKTD